MSDKQKSTEVTGQLYGYTLQLNRALAHLLRSKPGDVASIEVFDDTGLQQSAGGDGLCSASSCATYRQHWTRSESLCEEVARWCHWCRYIKQKWPRSQIPWHLAGKYLILESRGAFAWSNSGHAQAIGSTFDTID